MFFSLSKFVSWLISPLHALLLLQVIGVILLWRKPSRGRALIAGTTLTMLAITFLPVSELAIRPLEQAYLPPVQLPPKIVGIVLLGGAQDLALSAAYGRSALNGNADTTTNFVALGRRYPEAKLVFAGGSGELFPGAITEAEVVKRFFREQGMDPERLLVDDRSRNTYENVMLVKKVAEPKVGENWVLITQAGHMPRSIAVFKKLGWSVIPFPVAHQATPEGWHFFPYAPYQFGRLNSAIHEWVGLAVYGLTNRI